jgi:hypothetical protein
MSRPRKDGLVAHRRRLKAKGVLRLEVGVRKSGVALIRDVAAALADPAREGEARAVLRDHFAQASAKGLKALLAAAPLERIELRRARVTGRKIEL